MTMNPCLLLRHLRQLLLKAYLTRNKNPIGLYRYFLTIEQFYRRVEKGRDSEVESGKRSLGVGAVPAKSQVRYVISTVDYNCPRQQSRTALVNESLGQLLYYNPVVELLN